MVCLSLVVLLCCGSLYVFCDLFFCCCGVFPFVVITLWFVVMVCCVSFVDCYVVYGCLSLLCLLRHLFCVFGVFVSYVVECYFDVVCFFL